VRQVRQEKANEKANEKAEIQALNKEEGIVELDEDEKDRLIDLDSFTGPPTPPQSVTPAPPLALLLLFLT
jgi:hypothetical protein